MLIIHVSDIHFTENSNISFLPLYESIKHKIAISDKLVFLVSGDIAFSGKENEYIVFDKEIKKLAVKIRDDHNEKEIIIILAPGNHDCDFSENTNTTIRKMVIGNVKNNGITEKDDDSVFELCSSIQDNFFSYLSTVERSGNKTKSDRLCWQRKIELDTYSVVFTIYNTAWLSSIREDPGSLYFPKEILNRIHGSNFDKAYTIGLYHHPDNWISPKHDEQNHREFRNQVTRYNNLVLNGHEHQEHLEEYDDLSNGHDCYIHAGGAYFQNNSYECFSTIELNSDGNFDLEEFEYSKDKECFVITKHFNKKLSKNSPFNHNYEILSDYKQYLNDTEVYLSNSDSKKIFLKDTFTYPKLENIETENIEDSEEILKDDSLENIVLFGTDQSGKTSILKMIFTYWYYHGYTPLLLDAQEDIKNDNIRQMLKNKYKKEYNSYKTDFDQYQSLSYDNKIILVDNFHLLNRKLNRDDIINKLKGFSHKIILVCDDISALEENSFGNEKFIFEKYSILPFGHVNRDEIIEKWLVPNDLTPEELFQKKRIIHAQINDILGTNLVPSYPLFILTILQALDATTPLKSEITSYGHCYQTLIYLSFRQNGLKEDEFEVVDNFLSHLSNRMYELNEKYLSEDSIRDLYNEYSTDFIVTNDFNELMRVLLDSKTIIEDSMENYGFKYVYIYYYYVAKYISKYKLEEKGFIESLCSNLDKRENSFIILFITHHSDNQEIIEEIVYNTMDQFVEIDPITLVNSETDFMLNSVEIASSTVLENIKPEEYRQEELEKKDELLNETTDFQDVNENIRKINKALKSIEINGQLLKIRYGSIKKERIKNIIEESFLICFRLIRFLITDLSKEETTILLADQFEEYIRINSSKIPSHPSREELINAIQKVLSNITYYICHFTLDKTAYFLGNEKLISQYKEIAESIGTPASKLTLMLIEFKLTRKKFDRSRVKELKKEFKDNSFAYSLLQKAAVNYIYMHHLSHTDKTWIASTLNIPVVSQRKIENKKNK